MAYWWSTEEPSVFEKERKTMNQTHYQKYATIAIMTFPKRIIRLLSKEVIKLVYLQISFSTNVKIFGPSLRFSLLQSILISQCKATEQVILEMLLDTGKDTEGDPMS